jgi:hypothetical protein
MEWSPSISHDESKLYFSSSDPARPGHLDGMDLYVSEFGSNGWQIASNIRQLNSNGDEIDASIGFDDTTLYFASWHHHNLPCWHGPAVDIFVAYFSNGQWGNLQNLCDPINTQYWETCSNISSSGDTLYFARRRLPDYDEFADIYYSAKLPDAIEEKMPKPEKKEIKINLYPNPFNDGIKILVEAANDNVVTLSIYNIVGQSILKKEIDVINGLYSFNWDGANTANMPVPSGIYFISLQSKRNCVTDRILKLK